MRRKTESMYATIWRLIYNISDDELKLSVRSHFESCIRNNLPCYSYSIHKIAIMSSMCVSVCVPTFFISFNWRNLFTLIRSILIAQKCTFTVRFARNCYWRTGSVWSFVYLFVCLTRNFTWDVTSSSCPNECYSRVKEQHFCHCFNFQWMHS